METETQQKRGWKAFCCPECRCVFRLRQESSIAGAICPSCSYLLRLPENDEENHFQNQVRQKRHESHSRAQTLYYQKLNNPEAQWLGDGSKDKKLHILTILLILSLLGFLGIGGVGFFLIKRQATYKRSLTEYKEKAEQSSSVELSKPEEKENVADNEPVSMEVDQCLEIASQLLPKFLKAKSIQEMLDYIRPTKNIEQKLEKYYWDIPFEEDQVLNFNLGNSLYFDGKFAVMRVQTKKHSSKWAVFEMGENDLKLDWESWVVWSSMPWEKFIREKPVVPQEFRVKLGSANYFNFGFNDDKKWKCFSLESDNQEHYLYGYAEIGSLLEQQLTKNVVGSKHAGIITIEISYPKDAVASNQVMLHKLLRYGWVGEKE